MIDTTQGYGVTSITVTPNYAKSALIQIFERVNVRNRRLVSMYDVYVNDHKRSSHRDYALAVRKAMRVATQYDKAYEIDRSRGRFTR